MIICLDMIPIVHHYSDIENRVILQRIFRDSIKFKYKKLTTNFQIKFKEILYKQYFTKKIRQWLIIIPIYNSCSCYSIYYRLDTNRNEIYGVLFVNNDLEILDLQRVYSNNSPIMR